MFDIDLALELKEQFEKELLTDDLILLPLKNNTMEGESMTNDFMKGMFGTLGKGMCKITMDGNIAVKTSDGYKTYDKKSGSFLNCNNFCFGGLDEMFFVVPTNSVVEGDIIFIKGDKPRYVLKVDSNTITVINYENSTIETLLPERHMFMGNAYFYGKIVSMSGNGEDLTCGNGVQNIMKYMLINQMCKNMGGDSNPMAMMMFMNSGVMGNMFNHVFSAMGPSPTETKTDIDEG